VEESEELYIKYLKERFGEGLPDLSGLELTVDCAHGATYRVAPRIFSDLGADISSIGVNP